MRCLFLFLILLPLRAYALEDQATTSKEHLKTHLQLSGGMTSISLPSGSFSDPGFAFTAGRFFHPKFTLNGHYFLTAAPSGESNLNGFGLEAKYYFYNTETSFELKNNGGRVRSFDRFFAFGSLEFLDREVRTGRVNVSYTGFALSLGAGYKIDFHNSLGLEVTRGNLKNASGAATASEAEFTYIAVNYGYLF